MTPINLSTFVAKYITLNLDSSYIFVNSAWLIHVARRRRRRAKRTTHSL
jgi:hypothetical protein